MKAVLFDFNGTLYDDTRFHRAAWRNYMKQKFDMELSEEEIASAGASADSMWESGGDLYEKNGIGKDTLKNYLLNGTKADKLADLLYGEDGVSPISDEELAAFVTDECYYIEAVEFPLLDYSTYSFATEEQAAEIEAVADDCLAELTASATGETAQTSAVYNAAMTYVPEAMAATLYTAAIFTMMGFS